MPAQNCSGEAEWSKVVGGSPQVSLRSGMFAQCRGYVPRNKRAVFADRHSLTQTLCRRGAEIPSASSQTELWAEIPICCCKTAIAIRQATNYGVVQAGGGMSELADAERLMQKINALGAVRGLQVSPRQRP